MIVLCLILSLAIFETNAAWPPPPPTGQFPPLAKPQADRLIGWPTLPPPCYTGKQCGRKCCKADEVCKIYLGIFQ